MAIASAVQPAFFETQYLGAEDLTAIVDYFRTSDARHALSQRSWGVAVGLDLVPSEIAPGEFQITVMPGVALDGYGRLVVVTAPVAVPTEAFLGIASGPVKVWIRYDETPIRAARRGFGACGVEDAFARIEESFAIEVGERRSVLDRQSGVTVAGVAVSDAREAARSTNLDAPLLCDATVPYQEFPIDDEESIWLIPLGIVSWQSAANGFVLPTEDLRVAGRIFRRQFGAVAEDVLAANGLIRLRDRATAFDADIDAACATTGTKATDYVICDDDLKARELIWLEGDTRVTGDLRLFGARLEFRDAEGRDYVDRVAGGIAVAAIDPLVVERVENARDGHDLAVLIGPAATGHNRFAVGAATVTGADVCDLGLAAAPSFVVQDDGRVGIGTAGAPDSDLVAPLTIRGLEGEATIVDPVTGASSQETIWNLLRFEDSAGAAQWDLDLWTDGQALSLQRPGGVAGVVHVDAAGNVGVGTSAPQARLDVARTPISTGGGLGANLWLRLGDGGAEGDSGRVWVQYGPQNAPLVVLSDHDDPPRLQFQQTGAGGDETAPAHVAWVGHLAGSSPDLGVVTSGRIGLGTEAPFADVTVDGTLGFKPGTAPLVYMFETGTTNADRMVLAHSPSFAGWGLAYRDVGDRFVYQTAAGSPVMSVDMGAARVGVGTEAPAEALDVRGSIRLGGAGELFAVGSTPNLRAVAGEVAASGAAARGAGFFSLRTGEGLYTITFVPAFAAAPFVTATGMFNRDNVVSIDSVSNASCQIRCFDVLSGDGEDAGERDTAFTFIAMGAR